MDKWVIPPQWQGLFALIQKADANARKNIHGLQGEIWNVEDFSSLTSYIM